MQCSGSREAFGAHALPGMVTPERGDSNSAALTNKQKNHARFLDSFIPLQTIAARTKTTSYSANGIHVISWIPLFPMPEKTTQTASTYETIHSLLLASAALPFFCPHPPTSTPFADGAEMRRPSQQTVWLGVDFDHGFDKAGGALEACELVDNVTQAEAMGDPRRNVDGACFEQPEYVVERGGKGVAC